MKKYILIFMVSILLLSSCSIDWKDENKAKIDNLEKQVLELRKLNESKITVNKNKNDIFKNKQECIKLTNDLIKKAELHSIESPSLWKASFEQVFYSPEKNNCLWVITREQKLNSWWVIWEKNLYEVWNDTLSSIIQESCTKSIMVPWWTNDCDTFYEKIKKLKWE